MSKKSANELRAWKAYKKWQGENIESIRPGQEIRSFDEFKAIYNDYSVGRRIERIKYEVQYQVSGRTFARLQKRLRETQGEAAKEILASGEFTRAKSTHELAAFMTEDINEFRKRMQEADPTLSSSQLALLVSEYFFGS